MSGDAAAYLDIFKNISIQEKHELAKYELHLFGSYVVVIVCKLVEGRMSVTIMFLEVTIVLFFMIKNRRSKQSCDLRLMQSSTDQ